MKSLHLLSIDCLFQTRLTKLLKHVLRFEIWMNYKTPLKFPQHKDTALHMVISKYHKHNIWKRNKRVLTAPYQFDPSGKLMSCNAFASNEVERIMILNTSTGEEIEKLNTLAKQTILLNSSDLLYVTCDPTGRPWKVWRHRIGEEEQNDTLLFQNDNEYSTLNVSLTRDSNYVTMTTSSRLASQVHILKVSSSKLSNPVLISPMKHGIHYYIDHAHERFYMLTNEGKDKEFKILVSNDDSFDTWNIFYTSDNNFILQDMELFDKFIILYGNTHDVIPALIIINMNNNWTSETMVFKDYSHIDKFSEKFQSQSSHIAISSIVCPPKLITISRDSHHQHQQLTLSDKKYSIMRMKAMAKDDVKIPITMFLDKSQLKQDGSNPLLIRVYGSHGVPLHMGYNETILPLLRRGWILACCHIRGGGELGRQWYLQSVGNKKYTSFQDLQTCITHLQYHGYSSPMKTALWGQSTGALTAAMLCNMWPQTVQAVILENPLVNLYNCLKRDISHYINTMDREEFGDTNLNSHEEEHLIKSLCPFSNLKVKDYPSFLIMSSSNDHLIPIDGVEQYASKLTQCVSQYHANNHSCEVQYNRLPRGTVIFHKETEAGHWENTYNRQYRHKQGVIKAIFLQKSIET